MPVRLRVVVDLRVQALRAARVDSVVVAFVEEGKRTDEERQVGRLQEGVARTQDSTPPAQVVEVAEVVSCRSWWWCLAVMPMRQHPTSHPQRDQ